MIGNTPRGNKDKMHPDDMRNMFIFFIIAAILYMAANAFIFQPQEAAIKKAQQQQQHAAAVQTPSSLPGGAAPGAPAEKAATRDEILKAGGRIGFANDHVYGTINLTGGQIDDLSLKDYYTTLEKKDHVVLLSPKSTAHPRTIEYGWVGDAAGVKVPGPDSVWMAEDTAPLSPGHPVTLRWDNKAGLIFETLLTLDDTYMIDVTQSFTNKTGQAVTLHPYALVSQTGLPVDYKGLWVSHEGPIGFIGDELTEIKYPQFRKEPTHSVTASTGWTGITDKYWLAAIIPAQGQEATYRFNRSGPLPDKKQTDLGHYQVDFTGPGVTAAPATRAQYASHVFAGAKKVSLLESYGKKLGVRNFDLAVDFGWFWFLSKPFFWALHYIYQFIGNMGISIILLTIIIRSAVFPLTNLSYKSFAKMKKITPEIAKLRDQYGSDKVTLQQELMKLYQKEGVSPLAGCLPMIVQIPIFFALYKVLVVTIEMRHAPFFGWIKDLSAPDPTNIFNLFGLIPWEPPIFMHIGIWPCFMFIGFFMQKQLNPPPQDPIQRDMAIYFPFLMTYMMAKFASGLVIYWTFSALIGVTQQSIIMYRLGVPIHFLKSREEKRLEKAAQKGVPAHPLIGMAEEDAEEALFTEDDAPAKPMTPPKKRRKKKK